MTSKSLKGIALVWAFLLPFLVLSQSLSAQSLINRSFSWKYSGKEYNMEHNFERADYQHYRSIDRHWDYGRYTIEHVGHGVLGPIAKELAAFGKEQGFSDWETAEFIVAFVQSLEYQKEYISPDYPKFPVETLVEKGGDCEDTAILLATLFKQMGISSILLSPPGHMATGIAVSGKTGSHFAWKGQKYFYIETTGINWAIGSIPDSYDSEMKVYEVPGNAYHSPLVYGKSPARVQPDDLSLAFVRSRQGDRNTYGNKPAYTYSVSLKAPNQILQQVESVGYQRMHGTFHEYKRGSYIAASSAAKGFSSQWTGWGYVPIKVKVTFKDGSVKTFEHRGAPVARDN